MNPADIKRLSAKRDELVKELRVLFRKELTDENIKNINKLSFEILPYEFAHQMDYKL